MSAQAHTHEQTDAGEGVLAPYRAVHRHAEHELELAGRADLAGLAELGESWEQLIAGLPAQPPAAAAQLLEHARLIHERTRIELLRIRETLLADVAGTNRARRAADGYGSQRQRRPLTDLSA